MEVWKIAIPVTAAMVGGTLLVTSQFISFEEENQPPVAIAEVACNEMRLDKRYVDIYLGRDAEIVSKLDTPVEELIYHWAVLSSPDESTILLNNPNKLLASVCVDTIGEYQFVLTITDNEFASTDIVTVTVGE